MRRVLALLATAGMLTVALTACTTSGGDSSCVVHSGKASSLVHVQGRFGHEPKVSFPTPLKADGVQRSTIIDGSGARLQAGQMIKVKEALYDGRTGTLVGDNGFTRGSGAQLTLNAQNPSGEGVSKALQCATVGSRVVVTDPAGSRAASLGMKPSDQLVWVFDITKAYLPRADGAARPGQPGFPTVVLAPNGRPGITIPDNRKAPKKLEIETLKQGSGDIVARGKKVTLHYTAVFWKDNSVFDSTWEKKQPVTVLAKDQAKVTKNSKLQGLVKGVAKAVVGQRVGSQLVVIVPPSEGFGAKGGATQSGFVPPNSTLVYVVDILGLG